MTPTWMQRPAHLVYRGRGPAPSVRFTLANSAVAEIRYASVLFALESFRHEKLIRGFVLRDNDLYVQRSEFEPPVFCPWMMACQLAVDWNPERIVTMLSGLPAKYHPDKPVQHAPHQDDDGTKRLAELDALIALGWGDTPSNQLPPDWRVRRGPSYGTGARISVLDVAEEEAVDAGSADGSNREFSRLGDAGHSGNL